MYILYTHIMYVSIHYTCIYMYTYVCIYIYIIIKLHRLSTCAQSHVGICCFRHGGTVPVYRLIRQIHRTILGGQSGSGIGKDSWDCKLPHSPTAGSKPHWTCSNDTINITARGTIRCCIPAACWPYTAQPPVSCFSRRNVYCTRQALHLQLYMQNV